MDRGRHSPISCMNTHGVLNGVLNGVVLNGYSRGTVMTVLWQYRNRRFGPQRKTKWAPPSGRIRSERKRCVLSCVRATVALHVIIPLSNRRRCEHSRVLAQVWASPGADVGPAIGQAVPNPAQMRIHTQASTRRASLCTRVRARQQVRVRWLGVHSIRTQNSLRCCLWACANT